MKKYLILFLPILIFAYEIDFSKKFTKQLMPNILSANIMISIDDDKERYVIDRLEVFNKEIKKYKKVEKKLGSFNVRPIYQHSNNNPLIKGYKGTLRYTISSTDAMFIGEFVSMVTKLKRNRDTSISLSNLSWKVKDDSFNVTLDLLRLEAINWAENYVKTLSSDLNRECEVKSINFGVNNRPYPSYTRAVSLNSSAVREKMVVPEISEEKIALSTNFKLECK